MFCVRFDAKFVLLTIVLSSCVYCSAGARAIPCLVELLQNNPTLIRMGHLKIQSNISCSIDIPSTAELMEKGVFSSVCPSRFFLLKTMLRQMSCQFFTIRETLGGDGTIFTHDGFRELKSDNCNPSAVDNMYRVTKHKLPDKIISRKDVSALFDLNEPNSQWWMEEPNAPKASLVRVPKTIPLLIKLLQTYPTLIRMRMLKIQGHQPNPMCTIDISSTAELMKPFSSSSGVRSFSRFKLQLRAWSFQFFTLPESNPVDGTIFTNDVFRELKSDDCNPSALYNIRGGGPERFLPNIPIALTDISEPFDLNNEPISQWWMEEPISRKRMRMSEDQV